LSPLALRRYRAERLLRRDFDGLRTLVLGSVRRRLGARSVRLDADDLEACYAQAWQGLYTAVLSGEEVANPAGWLILVTFRRAIEDDRARSRARPTRDGELPEQVCEPDYPGRLDDMARLRQLFEGLRGRLSRRECEAASLCYLQGLTRAEAARRLGISDSRMRKLMDGGSGEAGVAAKVGALLSLIGAGRWCDEQASSMRGLAFGLLDPAGERHRLAVLHQRECSACRAYVASLRGLAAALPPVLLPLKLGTAAVGMAAGASTGVGASGGSAAGASTGFAAATAATGTASSGLGGAGGMIFGGLPLAKLAVGGAIALGLAAGGVALTGRSRPLQPPSRPPVPPGTHTDHASAPGVRHAAARPTTARPRVVPEARRRAQAPDVRSHRPARPSTTSLALGPAQAGSAQVLPGSARREFGLERRASGAAPTAKVAVGHPSAGSTSGHTAPAAGRRAQSEFGPAARRP